MAHVVHHRQMSHLNVKHPAQGLMRRLVDGSRMRIPVPVRSWPRWSRRIPTGIAHGIGHDHARVFMKSLWRQGGYPKWRSPHRTPRILATARWDLAWKPMPASTRSPLSARPSPAASAAVASTSLRRSAAENGDPLTRPVPRLRRDANSAAGVCTLRISSSLSGSSTPERIPSLS